MANLGKCPDCPASVHDQILILGKCHHHLHNPVEKKTRDSETKQANPERKTPNREIKRSNPEKKRQKPIKPASSKLVVDRAAYKILAEVFKGENRVCQINWEGCTIHATDLHHEAGRGKWLLQVEFFRACCRSCHDKAGADPKRAIAEGVSLPRHFKAEFYEELIQKRSNEAKSR